MTYEQRVAAHQKKREARYDRAEKALEELRANTGSYYCETQNGLHATSWVGPNPEFVNIEKAIAALHRARQKLDRPRPVTYQFVGTMSLEVTGD